LLITIAIPFVKDSTRTISNAADFPVAGRDIEGPIRTYYDPSDIGSDFLSRGDSCFDDIPCLEAFDKRCIFRRCPREPEAIHQTHLSLPMTGSRNEQWGDMSGLELEGCGLADTSGITPMGLTYNTLASPF
jgi:hypothetical protein